jgi:hypothetical protein
MASRIVWRHSVPVEATVINYRVLQTAAIEVCFCASFLAQTKKERGATSGLIQKAAVQISLM